MGPFLWGLLEPGFPLLLERWTKSIMRSDLQRSSELSWPVPISSSSRFAFSYYRLSRELCGRHSFALVSD